MLFKIVLSIALSAMASSIFGMIMTYVLLRNNNFVGIKRRIWIGVAICFVLIAAFELFYCLR